MQGMVWFPLSFVFRFLVLTLGCVILQVPGSAQAVPRGPIGPGNVIVTSMFGGQIFGFDIDQNGTEGILTEASFQPDGRLLAAVETFDQMTGKILRVVKQV